MKCPECKKELKNLNHYQSGHQFSNLFPHGKDYDIYFDEDKKINEYSCPYCLGLIATNKKEALKFLKKGVKE